MIGVGINENIVLKSATIEPPKSGTGQASLRLNMIEAGKGDFNPFDQMNAGTVIQDDVFQLTVWAFKAPDLKNKAGEVLDPGARSERASGDVTNARNVLTQLLGIYLTPEQIKWNVWDGTGMDKDNYSERIVEQSTLDVVYKNICEQFIAMASPFFGKEEHAMRMKLVRQSKEKHFARIPDRYLAENPWVELMTVPKESSRVKFTKWEIGQGLDDGTPISKEQSDEDVEKTPEDTENVFGKR